MPRKYGQKAQATIRKTMEEFKEGQLKAGRSGNFVNSRKQAVAIGLNKAWRKGQIAPTQK